MKKTILWNVSVTLLLFLTSCTAKSYPITQSDIIGEYYANKGKSDLSRVDTFKQLDTELYNYNLHYLNWSGQKQGRITGMTRFACFLEENGEIKLPIKDLGFDDIIYNFWRENLEQITNFGETALDSHTYSERSLGGSQCPGMIVKGFNFTL